MVSNKFNKVVVLDTVIFYPEHEEVLKRLVLNPKIERIPLEFNQHTKNWVLPEGYILPEDANIIIWPSTLPESFDGFSIEIHEKLGTGFCWVEEKLKEDTNAQNILNRVKDADCIITCWTPIPDIVLDHISPKAILTWTHEYGHRINVKKANEKNIYTGCVDDYGTVSVSELAFYMILELINRNFKDNNFLNANQVDLSIDCLLKLFDLYRKPNLNEKNLRLGKFSHHFYKIGRSVKYYSNLSDGNIHNVIPHKVLQGKSIGLIDLNGDFQNLYYILKEGFNCNVSKIGEINSNLSEFYGFLSQNDVVIYNSKLIKKKEDIRIISLIKGNELIDISEPSHYRVDLKNFTIGIIGLGRIGKYVAQIAQSMGINVQYNNNTVKYTEFDYVDLDTLISTSNIIFVSVPNHIEKEILTKERIDMIPNDTILINTSDANVVNQEALTKRMLQNEIFVGMDVYQGLPTTRNLCLDDNYKGKIKKQLHNHVLTYRAGWITYESIKIKTYKLLGHMIKALNN